MTKVNTVKYTWMYLPKELFEKLAVIAKQEDSSVARMLRIAVRAFLAKQKPAVKEVY